MCFRLGCNVPDDNMEVGVNEYKSGYNFPYDAWKTRIRKDYNQVFFSQRYFLPPVSINEQNKIGNEFLRRYYYTHKDKNGECMSHSFKYKTQCVVFFWHSDPNAQFDFTPYPPILKRNLDPSEWKIHNKPTESNASPPFGRIPNEKRTIRTIIPAEIAETHALFYGGIPRFRLFNSYFISNASRCLKRIEVIESIKARHPHNAQFFADADFNIFDCHYLNIDEALDFERKLLKIFRNNIGRWTRKRREEPFDKLAGGKNFHPLNQFWEIEKAKGVYKTEDLKFEIMENMLAGSKKYKYNAVELFLDDLE